MYQSPSPNPHGQKTVNDQSTGWFPLRWWRRLRQWFGKNQESVSTPDSHWHPSRTAEGPNKGRDPSSVTLRPGDRLQ
jgi:hypothetical protein